MVIFQKLSELENTRYENIQLMLKEKRIVYTDTPTILNLKSYNVIGRLIIIN
jgi:hypothetical protein